MRWDRFFEDLEDQLDSGQEAERIALETEAERRRLSHVTLRERLAALARGPEHASLALDLADGDVVTGRVAAVGVDWIALEGAGTEAVVVPLPSVRAIGLPHDDLLRTARPTAHGVSLSDRMGLGFVLRDAARRRVGVTVRMSGERILTGTVDRAAAAHLDLALHERGGPRRAGDVTGFRMVPFAAIVWVRLDDAGVSRRAG